MSGPRTHVPRRPRLAKASWILIPAMIGAVMVVSEEAGWTERTTALVLLACLGAFVVILVPLVEGAGPRRRGPTGQESEPRVDSAPAPLPPSGEQGATRPVRRGVDVFPKLGGPGNDGERSLSSEAPMRSPSESTTSDEVPGPRDPRQRFVRTREPEVVLPWRTSGEPNRGVVYVGRGVVEIQDIGFPTFQVVDPTWGGLGGKERTLRDGAILRIVSTNICGSDQHLVAGRQVTGGVVLGHEVTGEVVEVGPDVQFVRPGDLCSVPFDISCGRCAMCKKGQTGVCLNLRPGGAGGVHGSLGGQAEYVLVPYADWNLLRFPDRDQALENILDLTMLSDVFPTGFHAAITANVTSGSIVYVAGAGPFGLAAAHSAQLLGAAVVIVADLIPERLQQARSFGCETIDVSLSDPKDQLEQILGIPEVDAAIDMVGFEFRGVEGEAPATVVNSLLDVTRAGGHVALAGLIGTGRGSLSVRFGLGWAKAHSIAMGKCPVIRYHEELMKMILTGRARIASVVNATAITLDEAPVGYRGFEAGVAEKFVLDPHGLIPA